MSRYFLYIISLRFSYLEVLICLVDYFILYFMSFSRTKIFITISVILVGLGYWYFFYDSTPVTASATPVTVATGSIRTTVKSVGKISPIQSSLLSFTKLGNITKISKKVGDTIKKDEVIAEIDASSALLDIQSARISLSNAQNNYNSIANGSAEVSKIQAENTLASSKSKLTLSEKTLENLKIEAENSLADKKSNIEILKQRVELAEWEYSYAEKNQNNDTTTNSLERDTANAFILLEQIEQLFPDIIKDTKDLLHLEDKNSPFYGDFSSRDPGYKAKWEKDYATLVEAFAKYKAQILILRNESPRSFSGTLAALDSAKILVNDYATLVGSTFIYAIDASPESADFPSELHDSLKTTLRGFATDLNSKMTSLNSTLATLKGYGSDALQSLSNRNTVIQKKASLAQAKNDLASAEANLIAEDKSYATKILSAEEDIRTASASIKLNQASYSSTLLDAKSDLVNARNSLQSAELSLQKSYLVLEDYQIIAPFDGIIQDIPWNVWDATTTEEWVLVENKDLYEIVLSLDQIDIVKVKSGMSASIVIDAFPKDTFTGTVSRVSAVATETSGVISYEASVVLSIPDRTDIFSKMSATVEIILEEKNNILLLSSSAIQTQQGKSFVLVQSRGGAPERREITLGTTDGSKTEILTGLNAWDRIIPPNAARSWTNTPTSIQRGSSTNAWFGGWTGWPPVRF